MRVHHNGAFICAESRTLPFIISRPWTSSVHSPTEIACTSPRSLLFQALRKGVNTGWPAGINDDPSSTCAPLCTPTTTFARPQGIATLSSGGRSCRHHPSSTSASCAAQRMELPGCRAAAGALPNSRASGTPSGPEPGDLRA